MHDNWRDNYRKLIEPMSTPGFPFYSQSRKYRVVKKEDGYHVQKRGWFRWNTIKLVVDDNIWFWPIYEDAIYSNWKSAISRMNWQEL